MNSNNPKSLQSNQITTTSLSLNVTPNETDNLKITKQCSLQLEANDGKSVDFKINSRKNTNNKDIYITNKVSIYPIYFILIDNNMYNIIINLKYLPLE